MVRQNICLADYSACDCGCFRGGRAQNLQCTSRMGNGGHQLSLRSPLYAGGGLYAFASIPCEHRHYLRTVFAANKGYPGYFDLPGFFLSFLHHRFHRGIVFAQTSWSIGETSDSAALRVVPLIKTVIPVTFGLLLLQGLANFIRSIMLAVRGKEI